MIMTKKKTRSKKAKSKKASKKITRQSGAHNQKPQRKSLSKVVVKGPIVASLPFQARPSPPQALADSRVFTIEIDSIRADTTIGDLIVAFPRTRDVLMKHGLRFDVEEAGYLYMTLNVFSAIHGLAAGSLVQELHNVSLQPPLQPPSQQLRTVTAVPSV